MNGILTYAVMLGTLILAYVQFVIMLTELHKVWSHELKCLCTKTTTVLSESTESMKSWTKVFVYQDYHSLIGINSTKNYECEVSYIFIVLEINK